MSRAPSRRRWAGFAAVIGLFAATLTLAPPAHSARKAKHHWRWSVASTYGIDDGLEGSGVACPHGGVLDESRPIVANRTLPCGTRLWLCHRSSGVNYCAWAVTLDRGPFVDGRDFDLGPRVTRLLHFAGVGYVRWHPTGRHA